MFSFSTECNPGKAVRIVNVAGKNKESVSKRGRATQRVRDPVVTMGLPITDNADSDGQQSRFADRLSVL
jgi:hypothetical protein